jgi:hypothetical protein
MPTTTVIYKQGYLCKSQLLKEKEWSRGRNGRSHRVYNMEENENTWSKSETEVFELPEIKGIGACGFEPQTPTVSRWAIHLQPLQLIQ